ncbi:MAG TPA: GNAT family N-acetyltransferase [Gaiellaceae bacterium]
MIRLERLGGQHLGVLGPLAEDPDVRRFTRLPVPATPEARREWLGRYEAGRLDGTREAFAVVDAETGETVGLALAFGIDPERRSAELGYAVVPEARGRGVATTALAELTEWALAELDVPRLELRIDPDNHGSKRAAERCGYAFERLDDVEVWSR